MPVALTNLSRPGETDFYVGEHWLVQITGADPSKPVSCHAWHNGVDAGTTGYGSTDASGSFYMNPGTMGREDVGIWIEVWQVDGVQVLPTIQFRVRPPRISPSALPIEIPPGLWIYATSNPAMPDFIFISDDETVKAVSGDLSLGSVAVEGWAVPWNLCSTSIGSRLPARRRVYAY